jgi:DNA-binding GntR family transcriptional regulator
MTATGAKISREYDLKSDDRSGYSLTSLAYRSVSDMIRHRRLKGGQKILEAPLADNLGISRTPLREALQRLEGEGLVLKGDGRNYFVRKVDVGEYLHSLRLRLLIEPEAAVFAMPMIPRRLLIELRREVEDLMTESTYHTDSHWDSDDHLHDMIINFCGNSVMGKVLRDLRATTRLFEIDRLKDRLQPDSTEHLAILEAIEKEDAEETRRSVEAHIESLIAFARNNLRFSGA